MSDDTVMVQPVETFLEGSRLVHPESEPYPVSRSRMLELRGNGLVEHVGDVRRADPPVAAPEPEAPDAPPVSETPADPTAPRRRGRPPKAR